MITVRTLIPSFALILSFGNDVFQFYLLFFSSVPMWYVTLIIPRMYYILGITCSITFSFPTGLMVVIVCVVFHCVHVSVHVCSHTQTGVCVPWVSVLAFTLFFTLVCLLSADVHWASQPQASWIPLALSPISPEEHWGYRYMRNMLKYLHGFWGAGHGGAHL